ncbi:dehydrodolichyl diphosphate synthase 2 isoform X2 [Cryptomeria japonica]|uniref:dehydrodolichyl diphosphate synthase 2 isoform X2 n=1 Tax=Cryptomeria japonica TaxID=3369 RepID=UPI0025ACC397|nr:dehydrodolichyl diphosphate synthase 2 isoform X2 [Cryptomeria japonica]
MGLRGTVPLANGFNCNEQVQVPGSFASVHLCYGYSVNRLRCQIHPMAALKKETVWQVFHHCLHISGIERRRILSVCASIAESSIKGLGTEEIPVESGKEDNAYEDPLPYGLYPYLMPKHVAIIMDGNSRWAEQRGLPSTEGHRAGRIALTEAVKLSCKWGIEILTVFAFSTDNWLRPKTEVRYLMDLFQFVLEDELETLKRENIRLCVIGDLAVLTKSLQTSIVEVEEMTKNNSRLNLIIALSYSGRNDIVQACRRLARQVEDGNLKSTDITESLFEKELETSCVGDFGSPDLLIRTSGEQRLSNFLLWQLAYTELYFDDSFWPEFGEAQYAEALRSFQRRHRRFGKRVCNKTNGTINF